MNITQIKINGINEPVGFRLDSVSVSWKVTDTESKKAANTKIEIAKALCPDELIAKREGVELDFTGEVFELELEPRTEYVVRIAAEGDAGDTASAESRFETGKMNETWQAEWIAAEPGDDCHPIMKKGFNVKPGLRRARLYATGVGLFEAYINGKKLGDIELRSTQFYAFSGL